MKPQKLRFREAKEFYKEFVSEVEQSCPNAKTKVFQNQHFKVQNAPKELIEELQEAFKSSGHAVGK